MSYTLKHLIAHKVHPYQNLGIYKLLYSDFRTARILLVNKKFLSLCNDTSFVYAG